MPAMSSARERSRLHRSASGDRVRRRLQVTANRTGARGPRHQPQPAGVRARVAREPADRAPPAHAGVLRVCVTRRSRRLGIVLCLVTHVMSAAAQEQLLDRVLARIGTEAITQTDVQALVEFGLVEAKSATDPAAVRQAIERQLELREVSRFPAGRTAGGRHRTAAGGDEGACRGEARRGDAGQRVGRVPSPDTGARHAANTDCISTSALASRRRSARTRRASTSRSIATSSHATARP